MGFFTPSVKSLVKRGDVRGLVGRLDQKDMGEAWIALTVIGAPAVPALIEALGTQRGGAASGVLAEIGAPALPALVECIAGRDESKVIEAGVAISTMRERGVPLPANAVAALVSIKTGGAHLAVARRLAAADALGPLDVRNYVGGAALAGHTHGVSACAFSPDGRTIVSASAESTLKLWDAASGTCRATLAGTLGLACAFSPDGQMIVSGSADRTLKLWVAESGRETAPRAEPAGEAQAEGVGKRACLVFLWNKEAWSASEMAKVQERVQQEQGCPVETLGAVRVDGPFPTGPDGYVVATGMLACQQAGISMDDIGDIGYRPGVGIGLITVIVGGKGAVVEDRAVDPRLHMISSSPDGARWVAAATGQRVVDLRPPDEIAREERAATPLDQEDEAFAHEMLRLVAQADRCYGKDEAGYQAACAQMRSVGEHLAANGASERMQLVAYRVQAIGGRVRDCEIHWAGICGWQA